MAKNKIKSMGEAYSEFARDAKKKPKKEEGNTHEMQETEREEALEHMPEPGLDAAQAEELPDEIHEQIKPHILGIAKVLKHHNKGEKK